MKKLLSFLLAGTIFMTAGAQYCSHCLVATRNSSNFSVQYPPGVVSGDSIAIDASLGPYTYSYVGGVSYDTTNPVVIVPINGIVQMSPSGSNGAGFAFENAIGLKVDGTTRSGLGFNVNGIYGSGTPIAVFGISSNIEVKHTTMGNCLSFGFIKNEQSCTVSINYPNRLRSIFIDSNYFYNSSLDGLYIGSTDPYGTGRQITCDDTIFKPRPSGEANIRVWGNVLRNVGRQGIQVSGCDTLGYQVNNNNLDSIGTSLGGNQGVGIFIGQASANGIVQGNYVAQTWQHGYWGYGMQNNKIYNNHFDSTGIIGNNYNYPESPIQVSGVPNTYPNEFDIENNYTEGASSDTINHYGVYTDNQFGNFATTNNFICTSGTIGNNNPYTVIYSTNCGGVKPPVNIYLSSLSAKKNNGQVRAFQVMANQFTSLTYSTSDGKTVTINFNPVTP